MEYREEDFLMLSGIQHFAFCRRQWALIHIEQQWQENEYTVAGELLHKNAHDPFFNEKRKDVKVSRSMPVFSRTMGISGECDIVEFRKSDDGFPSTGIEDFIKSNPLSIRRAVLKIRKSDIFGLQLQACAGEMLSTDIQEGACLLWGTRLQADCYLLKGT